MFRFFVRNSLFQGFLVWWLYLSTGILLAAKKTSRVIFGLDVSNKNNLGKVGPPIHVFICDIDERLGDLHKLLIFKRVFNRDQHKNSIKVCHRSRDISACFNNGFWLQT